MVELSDTDPNSFSRPDECIVTHLHLDLDVDFIRRTLRGSVKVDVRKVTTLANRLVSVWYQKICDVTKHHTGHTVRTGASQIQVLGIGKMCMVRCIFLISIKTRKPS